MLNFVCLHFETLCSGTLSYICDICKDHHAVRMVPNISIYLLLVLEEKEYITKGFEKAGILEAVKMTQTVYARFENPFDEKRTIDNS